MTSASTMAAKKLKTKINPPRTEKPTAAVAEAPTRPTRERHLLAVASGR
jgi:hypothetical protein